MNVREKMDKLSDVNLDRVCKSTIYNIHGFFMGCESDKAITKAEFQGMLNSNIVGIVGRCCECISYSDGCDMFEEPCLSCNNDYSNFKSQE